MSISAWILVGLTFVVTVVLLPQVAKSRRMMGQARNDDRFSEGMRLLDVEDTPSADHSVEVAIHRKSVAGSKEKTITRPIKTAQDLRQYTNLKALRAAAISTRTNAAKIRARILVATVLVSLIVAGFAAVGALAWWVLAAPALGIFLTLLWGTIAASNGRKTDSQFIADIREVERRLEKSPAGRAALSLGRKHDNNHWAKVAQESLREGNHEGTLNEALQRIKQQQVSTGETVTVKYETQNTENSSHEMEQTVQSQAHAQATVPHKTLTKNRTTDKKNYDAEPEERTGKWTVPEIPAPTYTLRSSVAHRDVVVAQDAAPQNHEVASTPMRPKTAQALPAGEALSSEDIQSKPLDIQAILDRRRA